VSDAERPAKGTKGYILWGQHEQAFFFRVYNRDADGKVVDFQDYSLNVDDLEVEITDRFAVFDGDRLITGDTANIVED
jgi:hypothetical protein